MDWKMLLKSWAIPPESMPRLSIFWAFESAASARRLSVMSTPPHTAPWMRPTPSRRGVA